MSRQDRGQFTPDRSSHVLKVRGLPCPQCKTPIVVDPILLLSSAPIKCAACNLEMVVNTEKSAEALKALGNYMNAFNEVETNLASKVEDMTLPARRTLSSKVNTGGRRAPRRRSRGRGSL